MTYQTNNFLGLGETLTLSANVGTLQRTISFGFTEPYLFDRPISADSTLRRAGTASTRRSKLLWRLDIRYSSIPIPFRITCKTPTASRFLQLPVRHLGFTRLGLTYGFSATSIQSLSTAATALFDVLQFQALAGPSSLTGIHSSTLTPTLTYNTVDNPVNPTHGKSIFGSIAFQGGPIGGNVNSITEVVEAKYFRPNYHKRNVIAFRLLGAFTTGYRRQSRGSLQPFLPGRRRQLARI